MRNSHSDSSFSGSISTPVAPIAQFQSPCSQIVDVGSKSHEIGVISGRFQRILGFGTVMGHDMQQKTAVGAPNQGSFSEKLPPGVESNVATAQASHYLSPIALVQDGNPGYIAGYIAEEDAITTEDWDYSGCLPKVASNSPIAKAIPVLGDTRISNFLFDLSKLTNFHGSSDLFADCNQTAGGLGLAVAFLAHAIALHAAGNTIAVIKGHSFKLGDQRLGWKGGTFPLILCSTVPLPKSYTALVIGVFRWAFQLLIDPSHSWLVHGQGRPPANALGDASAWLSSQLEYDVSEIKATLKTLEVARGESREFRKEVLNWMKQHEQRTVAGSLGSGANFGEVLPCSRLRSVPDRDFSPKSASDRDLSGGLPSLIAQLEAIVSRSEERLHVGGLEIHNPDRQLDEDISSSNLDLFEIKALCHDSGVDISNLRPATITLISGFTKSENPVHPSHSNIGSNLLHQIFEWKPGLASGGIEDAMSQSKLIDLLYSSAENDSDSEPTTFTLGTFISKSAAPVQVRLKTQIQIFVFDPGPNSIKTPYFSQIICICHRVYAVLLEFGLSVWGNKLVLIRFGVILTKLW
ncbi:uncharacterized protein LOC143599721 [Bidens hawaiensis]|uniref:uncharacterized protein LOC143599721 n=1 Tax=Bidens hawaiensis TaxID=980011 RepID=UPI004049D717